MQDKPFYQRPVEERKIAVSGGFDPIHIGHIRLFKKAATFGPLYVILNSDDFLMQKKGYVFMPFAERKEIIEALGCVHAVVECIDTDNTVCETLRQLEPDAFLNGGDRVPGNIPERAVCDELGIAMIFGIGGDKIKSSSKICEDYGIQKNRLGMVDETGSLPVTVGEDSSSEGADIVSGAPTS